MELVKSYLGNNVEFKMVDGEVYANATQMAKCFPAKNLSNWINSKGTEEYINALCSESKRNRDFYIDVNKGGIEQGTWIHETLCLDLARWMNVSFRIWCDTQIATLIRDGEVRLKVPKTYAEALIEAGRLALENEKLAEENKQKDRILEEQKPKVEFADKVLGTHDNLLVREYSKIVYEEGVDIGEKKLYAWLRNNGYLMKNNEPMQRYMKYFFIKESVYKTPFGERLARTTMITPSGQIYFYSKLKEEFGRV